MAFKGAEYNAYNLDWDVTPEQHPDVDLKDLGTLRERSHQLIRDDLVVAGIQQAYINQIAGTGPVIYSASKNRIQREQANKFLEERLANCDPSGSKSIADLVEELISTSFADGDVGINLPMINDSTVVELVEAFRIDTPTNEINNTLIRHGVEYNTAGEIVGYHVLKSSDIYHYGIFRSAYDFFPTWITANGYARKVFRLFKAPSNSRPLASRQYPLVTPMIPFLKHLYDYQEAVIVGARVAACFAGFIESDNPAGTQKSIENDVDPKTGKGVMKIKPGTMTALGKGKTVKFSAPNRPSDNHDAYILRCYKTIAMAYRMPYIIAFQDTEQTSYSSFKGAILDTAKLVGRWRRSLTDIILWIVNTLVLEGIAKGQIRGSLSTINLRVRWPSMGALDIEKESRGNKISLVDNRTKSRQMVCDEENIDFDELEEDLLEEGLLEVDREAALLIRKKEWEEKEGIIFPETVQPESDNGSDTDGSSGADDSEATREARKSDGNW